MLYRDRQLVIEVFEKEIRSVTIELHAQSELAATFSVDMASSMERFNRITPPLQKAHDDAMAEVDRLLKRLEHLNAARVRL